MIGFDILGMYNKGYSIDYIVKQYYKFINKDSKPYYVNDHLILPKKKYDKTYCRGVVYRTLYSSMYSNK